MGQTVGAKTIPQVKEVFDCLTLSGLNTVVMDSFLSHLKTSQFQLKHLPELLCTSRTWTCSFWESGQHQRMDDFTQLSGQDPTPASLV